MKKVQCIVCDAPVEEVLNLNIQALANNLISAANEPFDVFPLGLSGCSNCGHAQLTDFVNPELLFKDYLYASGTSQTLKAFFEWFADNLVAALPTNGKVLELASNDGTLLSIMAARGLEVTGVDPAANLTKVAAEKGLNVLTGFFPETSPEGVYDAIIAMNVAAHTPDPLTFVKGIAKSLKQTGVAIIQTSQALMIANGEFDTIYHEHYSFYSVRSMRALAERAGLVLEQTQLVSVHGTSFLFYLRHPAQTPVNFSQSPPFTVAWPTRVPPPLRSDFTGDVATNAFHEFADKARSLIKVLRGIAAKHRAGGRDIALIGVAAKALTFIRAADIAPDSYFDEAPLKIGRYVPGASTPIRGLSDLPKLTRETVFLMGAWNFADELMRKINSMALPVQHHFLIHLPEVRERLAAVQA